MVLWSMRNQAGLSWCCLGKVLAATTRDLPATWILDTGASYPFMYLGDVVDAAQRVKKSDRTVLIQTASGVVSMNQDVDTYVPALGMDVLSAW